jgi:hypothetical protein
MTNPFSFARKFCAVLVPVIALAFTSCEVKKTEEGKAPDVDVDVKDPGNLPKYEVKKTEEGRMPDVDVSADPGKLPDVEVKGPDVEVKTKKVEMEVPDVDVKTPEEQRAEAGATATPAPTATP